MKGYQLLIALVFCAVAGLIGQTGRDAYRQAYDVWQQAQANLERDAGTGGSAQVAQADRSAAAAESFEALYCRTFPRVYGYVASLLRDRGAAEDVTAQAFERAYRKRNSFRSKRGSREAWLFGIARNAALDELRKR